MQLMKQGICYLTVDFTHPGSFESTPLFRGELTAKLQHCSTTAPQFISNLRTNKCTYFPNSSLTFARTFSASFNFTGCPIFFAALRSSFA
jgi:hypothetical protein